MCVQVITGYNRNEENERKNRGQLVLQRSGNIMLRQSYLCTYKVCIFFADKWLGKKNRGGNEITLTEKRKKRKRNMEEK